MPTKLWSILLTGTLILTTGEFPALAQECEQAHPAQFSNVKAIILRLGTGETVHITLTLADKSHRSGYVSEIDDDSFVVTNPVSQTRVRVGYGEPMRLHAENSVTGLKLQFPAERKRIVRAAIRVASFGIAGRGHSVAPTNNFLSTRGAIIFFAVLTVVFVVIGVELKKS